jgi:cystathionine beta-synthase
MSSPAPEGPAKCTWRLGASNSASPHVHIPVQSRPKIMDTILDNIGNTPMVRINKITQEEGIECEIRKSLFFLFSFTPLDSDE